MKVSARLTVSEGDAAQKPAPTERAGTPPLDLEDPAQSLLQVVETYHKRRCEEIVGQGQVQARTIVRDAYRDGRRRLRETILGERRRARAQIASAQAELQTYRRQCEQQSTRALLEVAWPRLRSELLHRWQDGAARRTWVDSLLQQALGSLPQGRWRIHHPPDWPFEEQERSAEFLAAFLQETPEFQADAALRAGLRVCGPSSGTGETCLDGSLDTLLADRKALEARLLDLIEAEAT
jgi:F0F1-type ATP synthase membrane subunit b/b'